MICKKDYDGRTFKGSNAPHTGLEYDERQASAKTAHVKALDKQNLKNVENFIMKLPYRRPILLPQASCGILYAAWRCGGCKPELEGLR